MTTRSRHSRSASLAAVIAVAALALPLAAGAQDVPGPPPVPPSLPSGEPNLPEPILPCVVPALKGLTVNAATTRLRRTVGKVTFKRGRARKGIVLSQSARPGKAFAGGSPIGLIVGGRK